MAPYLPQSGAGGGGSPYSEGGALYALGLIHANHGEGIKQFLRDSLCSTNGEVIQHGACLGLGLPEESGDSRSGLHLSTPKRMVVSPLKKHEIKKLARRRKIKRWSTLEEDTLRTGVQKFGRGN
ncbi:26S proteasome non-ATPase regulatory subunit 1 homolog A-like [Camellia sinensis]|uniref:26S proteasome non-ATPase regulatory subunit 1 homolog A-like n=1 Tax=Camellia sinensis TaxID=4442 RepID=UPI0010367380|nr:26S proteasome non-ATPase regulatory subunit 1 homolog A-like [Camellia sinensis]